jgi:shikimate dehydrogenase
MIEPVLVGGSSQLIGLIGDPVAHSLSPFIHNHVFSRNKLPFIYVPLRVPRDQLGLAVTALRACSFAGANVTVPHKTAVLPWCDILSDIASAAGAANTLYMREGLLHATSTDAEGFIKALASMGITPEESTIVILGNGGVARSLGFSLALQYRPQSLTLVGRDERRVRRLADEIAQVTATPVAGATFSSANLRDILAGCTLLVNGTSVGMHPHTNASPLDPGLLHPRMTVFDTIYNPAKTLLMAHAEAIGCRVQNGLRMLLYQGLASQRYWTGQEVADNLFDLAELQSMAAPKG